MRWAGLFDFRPGLDSGLQRRQIVAHNYPRAAHNNCMCKRNGLSRCVRVATRYPLTAAVVTCCFENPPDLKAAQP